MQWDYPWLLWGLAALPALIYGSVIQWRQKRDFWRHWCRLPFMRRQSMGPSRRRYGVAAALRLAGVALSLLGFASPVVMRTAWEPVWDNVALVILADFSKSMEAPRRAQDINAPSRFEDMRASLLAFLQALPPGVRISLAPFSETAIPITSGFSDDHGELIAKVRRFRRDFFYKQGTDLSLALQEGFHLADAAAGSPVTSLVLISDGDEPVSQALRQVLAKRGAATPVFAIGVGAEAPVYIPEPLSPVGYIVDQQGAPVATALNAATLRFIAEQTGGAYYPFERRGQLSAALKDIVERQGRRRQHAYTYPYPLRSFCFLGAFCCLSVGWKLGV